MVRSDERVSSVKNKATAGGFLILSFGLLVALLYRQYFLGQEIAQYGDIFAIWFLGNAYVAFATVLKGVQPFAGRKMSKFVIPAIIAVTITAIFYIRQNDHSVLSLVTSFLVSYGGSFLVLLLLWKLYYWWEEKNLN